MLKKIKTLCFISFQYIIPQHGLSRLIGKLASSENIFLKNCLINLAIKKFKIDLSESLISNPKEFKTFNQFFTRKLKPGARNFPNRNINLENNLNIPEKIISPADGSISQIGKIQAGRIFQAKKHFFNLEELLGELPLAFVSPLVGETDLKATPKVREGALDLDLNQFNQGNFCTIYLSPRDYHRVHMPLSGKLLAYRHIPGDLFSVNNTTADNIPNLFARNERVCFFFEDLNQKPFIVIMVGALLVASIGTSFTGIINPRKSKKIFTKKLDQPLFFNQGDELGFFQFGSTAIILFPEDIKFSHQNNLNPGSKILCGMEI